MDESNLITLSNAKVQEDFRSSFISLQERIATFYHIVSPDLKEQAIKSAITLWRDILINKNRKELYNALFNDKYKDTDNKFSNRRDFRKSYQFALDLSSNWPFERALLPYLNQFIDLDCSKFELNPNSSDYDTLLGWGEVDKKDDIREINGASDFISTINDKIYYFELKNIMSPDFNSANFKLTSSPCVNRDDELEQYNIIFLNFDGVGYTKSNHRKDIFKFRAYRLSWEEILKAHIHYPPQFGSRKKAYLIHFDGEDSCKLHDRNGQCDINSIGHRDDCFIYPSKPFFDCDIDYNKDIKPFINFDREKKIVKKILSRIYSPN